MREREAIEGQKVEGMEEGGKCTGKVVLVIVICNRVQLALALFAICVTLALLLQIIIEKKRGGEGVEEGR